MKYLGIDYGLKKVGVSISEGVSASSLKILDVTSLVDAVNKVDKVISNEGIERVVIGLSESGESRKITLSFIKALQERSPSIKIVEVPETLSTQRAKEQMIQLGSSKKARQRDDNIAALIILEDYLEKKLKEL